MTYSGQFLNPSEAARRLGVSTKALRLYEECGMIAPTRTAAGWRTYGPEEMARAAEIVALRELGLSLIDVAGVLDGDPQALEPALAAHQATLERKMSELNETIEKVYSLRTTIASGQAPDATAVTHIVRPHNGEHVVFNLPWPWGGETFELHDVRPLNFITGPLGSGKTRLANTIADALPDAAFLGLERLDDDAAGAHARLHTDAVLKSRVDRTLAWLVDDGASASDALIALIVGLESRGSSILVVDLIEQGLDQASQEALIGYLRQQATTARPLFLMTRSSAILDLSATGPDEAIILCPANHSPPILVAPYPGAPGYEAVATCLAPPEVRARTEGVIAIRPQRA
ncbi:MAG: MerR family transcriptional regulator [Hyphomicrobiales bacterium]|nr:MerR family transcriptional regulator [Hyphomicrobiales bacterium]